MPYQLKQTYPYIENDYLLVNKMFMSDSKNNFYATKDNQKKLDNMDDQRLLADDMSNDECFKRLLKGLVCETFIDNEIDDYSEINSQDSDDNNNEIDQISNGGDEVSINQKIEVEDDNGFKSDSDDEKISEYYSEELEEISNDVEEMVEIESPKTKARKKGSGGPRHSEIPELPSHMEYTRNSSDDDDTSGNESEGDEETENENSEDCEVSDKDCSSSQDENDEVEVSKPEKSESSKSKTIINETQEQSEESEAMESQDNNDSFNGIRRSKSESAEGKTNSAGIEESLGDKTEEAKDEGQMDNEAIEGSLGDKTGEEHIQNDKIKKANTMRFECDEEDGDEETSFGGIKRKKTEESEDGSGIDLSNIGDSDSCATKEDIK